MITKKSLLILITTFALSLSFSLVLAVITPESLSPETQQKYPSLFPPQQETNTSQNNYKLTPPNPLNNLTPSFPSSQQQTSPGQPVSPGQPTTKGVYKLPNPLGTTSTFAEIIDRIAGYLIIIAAPIVTLMILIAAFKILTAGDNPENLKSAKQMILWTVIGYAIILLSKGITLIIKQLLGS